MEEWKYNFVPVSKDEWFRQIKADLKGKPFDSIRTEWWPGEFIIPLHHQEDTGDQKIVLPDSYFSKPPLVMEWFDVTPSNHSLIHSKIIRALEAGTQSIVIEFQDEIELRFDKWLKDVHTDMIEVSVNLQSGFIPAAINELPSNVFIRLDRSEETLNSSLHQHLDLKNNKNTSLKYAYEIPLTDGWMDEVVAVFKIIQHDLSLWTSEGRDEVEFLKKCILLIRPDVDFFKQVVQMRVLQLLWLNFTASYSIPDIPFGSPLESHIQQRGIINPDNFLIRAASTALGAALTGVNSLCIHHTDKADIPDFYSRINRNIQHLLNLESEIYKGVDPMAGSYTIDYYTSKWTKEIWEKLF